MSFGSAIGAIISQNNNRRKTTCRAKKFARTSGSTIEAIKSHRKASPEELQALREKMQKEHKKRQLKIILITAVFALVLLSFFVYFM